MRGVVRAGEWVGPGRESVRKAGAAKQCTCLPPALPIKVPCCTEAFAAASGMHEDMWLLRSSGHREGG